MEDGRKESPLAGMPVELVKAIVGQLDLDEDAGLSALPNLLLVNKSIKAMAEELHPETLEYYQQCIAKHLVKHPSQALAVEMARSPALAQLEDLYIGFEEWMKPGRRHEFKDLREGVLSDRCIESVNALMLLCPKLHSFRWNLHAIKVRSWDEMEISRSRCLRELEFAGVPLNEDGGTLDLSNALTIESFTMTYDYLKTPSSASSPWLKLPPNVQRLELKLEMDVEALVPLGIPDLPCLTELNLSWNPIGAEGVRHLQVGASRTLRKVNLRGTGGGNAIFEALGLDGSGTKLESLDLSNNDITNPSLLHLGHNMSLRNLDLSGNPLQNLEFGLDRNSSLEVLNLYHLRGPCPSRVHISSLSCQLANNTTLRSLDLSESELTDEMLDGLDFSPSTGLQTLDLTWNDISEATARRLSARAESLTVRRTRRDGSEYSEVDECV